jgi:hypothetical protein
MTPRSATRSTAARAFQPQWISHFLLGICGAIALRMSTYTFRFLSTAVCFVLGCSAVDDDGLTAGNGSVGAGGSGTGGTPNSGGGLAIGGSNSGGGVSIGGGGSGGMAGGVVTAGGGAGSTTSCTVPTDTPSADQCGNGLDEDLNGFVDEGCTCAIGQTQPCFGGPPSQASLPNCTKGTQTCTKSGEFGQWGPCTGWTCGPATPPAEICDNGQDEDCDGQIDDGCSLTVTVNIDDDCVSAHCPPQAPYPAGCNLNMDGGDSRGCVANAPGSSSVYFQEGDECPSDWCPFCDSGHISGTLLCSSQLPAGGLNETNCPINKPNKFYPTSPAGCP